MLAVIQIGGHQYIVSQGDKFRVDSKMSASGTVVCDKVLLLTEADGKSFQVGTPYIDGMIVECKVLGDGKSKKVRVFKMESKKRFQKTYGHRQDYVDLEVMKIGKGAAKKSAPAKEDQTESAAKKSVDKKPAVKKPVAEVVVKKSSVAKKPSVKKG